MEIMNLKDKSKAFQNEKEIGKNLKCLRPDRGGEFISNEFNGFCNERGIKRKLSTPGKP